MRVENYNMLLGTTMLALGVVQRHTSDERVRTVVHTLLKAYRNELEAPLSKEELKDLEADCMRALDDAAERVPGARAVFGPGTVAVRSAENEVQAAYAALMATTQFAQSDIDHYEDLVFYLDAVLGAALLIFRNISHPANG